MTDRIPCSESATSPPSVFSIHESLLRFIRLFRVHQHNLNEPFPHLFFKLRLVRLDQHLAKLPEFLWTSHFFCEERQSNDIEELVIKLVGFFKIFLLHRVPDRAVRAVRTCDATLSGSAFYGKTVTHTFRGEEELIHNDIMRIDLVCCEFLDETLRFVE